MYKVIRNKELDFLGQSYSTVSPNLHKYPATMLPQIGNYLLNELNANKGSMLDPYCGSGSSFVSGLQADFERLVGYDLNPLAIHICQSKFTKINLNELKQQIIKLREAVYEALKKDSLSLLDNESDKITNFTYWFSAEVARDLRLIKYFINFIKKEGSKKFISLAFAETVRECSYTRSNEFKMYRIKEEQTLLFNPDVYGLFFAKLERNLAIYQSCYYPLLTEKRELNFHNNVFHNSNKKYDVVLTSPPYGDSKTTVAYGQFSLFANAWAGIERANSLDNNLMGGKRAKTLFENSLINTQLWQINEQDDKRALEISSFYYDLDSSIREVAKAVKLGGYAIYVVGNRLIKGITLATDQFIAERFERYGFKHLITYQRLLSNKRMPVQNSPSNVKGIKANTMLYEYAVVCTAVGNKS
ncbi:MAG: modification methylase [Spirochaetaceae bacterium]|nr:modification methylase [Spirochaetaceae bacterium]